MKKHFGPKLSFCRYYRVRADHFLLATDKKRQFFLTLLLGLACNDAFNVNKVKRTPNLKVFCQNFQ